jgi:hypothetical protein
MTIKTMGRTGLVTLLFLLCGRDATLGSIIIGTESLTGIRANTSPTGGNIQTSGLNYTIQSFRVAARTGNYLLGPLSGTTVTSAPVSISTLPGPLSPSSLAFGSAAWGTFTATKFLSQTLFVGGGLASRSLFFIGIFTPGSAFPGSLTANANTSLTITFTQPSAGGAIGSGASLSSPAANPPSSIVPEPATVGLAILGLIPLVMVRKRQTVR